MQNGYLSFDDAYFLASSYIQEHPEILPILRERFQYVFVDKMQDMSENQFQLLETLFATTNYSIKKYRFCFYHRRYLSATQSIHKRIN